MVRKTRAFYLKRLQTLARRRGGTLVSRRYVNDTTKLRFRCAEGHTWMQAPGSVKMGSWCKPCGTARGAALHKAPAIARLHRLVARRGGVVLSKQYVDSQTKLRYRCRANHEWSTVPNNIARGYWCPVCPSEGRMKYQRERKRRVFDRISRIVKRSGGTILSPEFPGTSETLRLRCARDHTWDAPVASIDVGVWCLTCKEGDLLEQLQAVAKKWGGECLSNRCLGGKDRLLWRCRQGHRWRTPGQTIKRGIWCPRCRNAATGSLEQVRRIALERGGKCLSNKYVNCSTRMRWRCHEGHEWEAGASSIVSGSWCRVCERGWGQSRARLSIEIMHEMARERGGACLSRTYEGIYDRLRWRCASGHRWVTPANNVRRGGWCPVCAHSVRGTLDGMRAMATERGGRCLTKIWNDHRRPLLFECKRGHRFRVPINVVKSGVWCPQCRK